MGEKINEAIKLITKLYKEEYGEEAQLEDGESIVGVLNDSTLIITNEDGKTKVAFYLGKPYQIDFNMDE